MQRCRPMPQAAPHLPIRSDSPQLVLVGGGVRCGKSAFAIERARRLGERRLYIATAEALDDEMSQRIAAHRTERGAAFETIEEPLLLPEALLDARADVVVVDCLTLWLSNLLMREPSEQVLETRIGALVSALCARRFHTIVVTNEVGMGLVPESALGRRFRDSAGRAHQRIAAICDEVYFGMLGSMLRLRPEPVCLQHLGA